MVSKYQVLLSLQVLQYANCGLGVITRNVPKYEHMIVFIYNPIPVLHQPIVVIPRTVQLVMRKSQVILCPSNWIRVCLISKVNIWYIKVIGQNFSPISTITIYKKNQIFNLSNIQPQMLGLPTTHINTSISNRTMNMLAIEKGTFNWFWRKHIQ